MSQTSIIGSDVEAVVVVVDDDPDLLELFLRALKNKSIDARGVSDFSELMHILESVTPALILMDVNMPELFGDEVGAILKEGHRTPSKIYLHSSLDDAELRKMVSDAGLDGFIPKSAGTKHMVARVTELLADIVG